METLFKQLEAHNKQAGGDASAAAVRVGAMILSLDSIEVWLLCCGFTMSFDWFQRFVDVFKLYCLSLELNGHQPVVAQAKSDDYALQSSKLMLAVQY